MRMRIAILRIRVSRVFIVNRHFTLSRVAQWLTKNGKIRFAFARVQRDAWQAGCLSLGMRARSALRVHCEAKKRTCDREPHAQAWNFSNVAATAVCGHAAAGCDDVACAALDVPQ